MGPLRPLLEHNVLTIWNWMVSYPDNLELGNRIDIGAFTYMQAKYGVIIEDNVQIGSQCSIYSESTINDKRGQVVLREGCKLGSHSIIMPGVTIGKNAIIGAHGYIDKDVAEGEKILPAYLNLRVSQHSHGPGC